MTMLPARRLAAPGRDPIHRARSRRLGLALVAAVLAATWWLGVARVSAAEPSAPLWWAGAEVVPSNLAPEHEGQLLLAVRNLGGASASGAGEHPIVVSDSLPAGLTASAIASTGAKCTLTSLQCVASDNIAPYQKLSIAITVKVNRPAGTVEELPNQITVEGGGAHPVTTTQRLHISAAATPFGVQDYELTPLDADGSVDTKAGSHPFGLTSTLTLNMVGPTPERQPAALARDLRFPLPLGMIGDPQAVDQCPMTEFVAHKPLTEVDLCPASSVVGIASVTIDEPEVVKVDTLTVPVFNLPPSEGEPARFGLDPLGIVPITIDTSVSPGDDYDVTASVSNTSEIVGLLSAQVTFWGVPGDARPMPSGDGNASVTASTTKKAKSQRLAQLPVPAGNAVVDVADVVSGHACRRTPRDLDGSGLLGRKQLPQADAICLVGALG